MRWEAKSGERLSLVHFRRLPLIFSQISSAYFEKNIPVSNWLSRRRPRSSSSRGLEEKELDLALISEASPSPRIEIQELFTEELLLACRHPRTLWFDKKRWSPPTCSKKNSSSCRMGIASAHRPGSFAKARDSTPEISCRSAQIGTVLAMVQSGLGISLLPEIALRSAPKEGIVYRSLNGARPRRVLALALSAQRKPSLLCGVEPPTSCGRHHSTTSW